MSITGLKITELPKITKAQAISDGAIVPVQYIDGSGNSFNAAVDASDMYTPGPQGAQGLQGLQGLQGNPGPQGTAATVTVGHTTTLGAGVNALVTYSGTPSAVTLYFGIPQGAPGATGAQGVQGAQGAQGVQGATGNDGAQGVPGVQGNPGTQGLTGPQGIQGMPGNLSSTWEAITVNSTSAPAANQIAITFNNTATPLDVGDWFSIGVDCVEGKLAVAGTVISGVGSSLVIRSSTAIECYGYANIVSGNIAVYIYAISGNLTYNTVDYSYALRGIAGPQGIQGLQGPQGVPGAQGQQGVQGVKGDQGLPGPQGLQGIQGIQGNDGMQGPQGLQGIQGLQGAQGDPGPQGLTGPQGIPGPIATVPSGLTFKGVISGTAPANPSTDWLWQATTNGGTPVFGASDPGTNEWNGSAWNTVTTTWEPKDFDAWKNENDNTAWYWLGTGWLKLVFDVDLSKVTDYATFQSVTADLNAQIAALSARLTAIGG